MRRVLSITAQPNGASTAPADADAPARGMTVAELARYLRIGRGRLRAMIRRGEMGAINTTPTRCGRPRYVILPHHLAQWEKRHSAATETPAPRRQRRMAGVIDFYPD